MKTPIEGEIMGAYEDRIARLEAAIALEPVDKVPSALVTPQATLCSHIGFLVPILEN